MERVRWSRDRKRGGGFLERAGTEMERELEQIWRENWNRDEERA
jgi:hypothetical protein